jgi:hypothetical protein
MYKDSVFHHFHGSRKNAVQIEANINIKAQLLKAQQKEICGKFILV